jgi:hypothetical protein
LGIGSLHITDVPSGPSGSRPGADRKPCCWNGRGCW